MSNTGSVLKCIFPKVLQKSSGVDSTTRRDRGLVVLSDGLYGSQIHTWKQSHDLRQARDASRGSRDSDTGQSFKNVSLILSVHILHLTVSIRAGYLKMMIPVVIKRPTEYFI